MSKPIRSHAIALVLGVIAAGAGAQEAVVLDPADLHQPLARSWPTYSGDYSGRRYSALTQIDRASVRHLTLAWTARMNATVRGGAAGGVSASPTARGIVTIQGGEGSGDVPPQSPNIKGAVLQVDGVLYVTAPDHVWALDPRDGTELWHYFWKTRGGTHIANRGAALWRNALLFETPDNYLVSLDARTGKELWHMPLASFEEQYFSTMAPIVIGDRVLVGTGNDSDMPGFLQAFDPATGTLFWRFYTTPQQPGDPGLDTWPNLEAARHGGGQVWLPGAYDPETDLYIFGTGNPTPGYTGVARPGDNLFTCSLLAVKVATGKLAWYFQTSPHDTHDWDSAQTPILIDGVIDGKPRKLVSTAARNGYFFTLDRVTGEHLVTQPFGRTMNWSLGVRPSGSPEPNPAKEATIPGSLVSPIEGGVVNWQPPAFNPEYGLFYSHENNGFNIVYLTDPDPRGSMGLGGKRVAIVGFDGNAIQAIDYRTGKAAWRHEWPGGGGVGAGMLATASGLLFTGDGNGNLVALDGKTGAFLWHSRIGNISNGPQTWELDGRQHLLVAVNDMLYDFVLY
ncbi:MAG: acido-empty-quinoprotein group A [Gammaproteobacteria bacterium]|nr:acido-empty-quinoprotein group A [Gammaproteobacteria bacterium]